MVKRIKIKKNKLLPLVILLIVAAVVGGYFLNKEYDFLPEGFNSNVYCSSYESAVLNGVGLGNLATGTAVKYTQQNGKLTLHFQANLPESQATFELTEKDNCECHCNNLFDCHCGNGAVPGCPFFLAKLVNPKTGETVPVGRMFKFRDGIYRTTKSFSNAKSINQYTQIVVEFQGNVGNSGYGPEIPVLQGKFSSR